MQGKPLFVRAEWDEEARVWVATSDDVPGLATEEETLETLVDKLKGLIPELLEANGSLEDTEAPFEIGQPRDLVQSFNRNQVCC